MGPLQERLGGVQPTPNLRLGAPEAAAGGSGSHWGRSCFVVLFSAGAASRCQEPQGTQSSPSPLRLSPTAPGQRFPEGHPQRGETLTGEGSRAEPVPWG